MSDGSLSIAMLAIHSCPLGEPGAKDTGGMSVYVTELARELGKQGHHVDIYTRSHTADHPQMIELGQNARLIHIHAGEEDQLNKLVIYPLLPDVACGIEAFRKENSLKYDIVFSHYWLSGWVGEYLEHWWHVPHLIMFHTLGESKNATGIGEDEPDLRLETERELALNCDRIIAPTEREKNELINRYDARPDKISIVPCGVNLEMFHPFNRAEARHQIGINGDKTVLFVGRFEPVKGLDRLFETIACLHNGMRPKLLVVGGDENGQEEKERLEKLSKALNISDYVQFAGLVKHELLPYFYSAANVCIITSYYESFGLVALESLACGTPVVATDVGDLKNIIRQGETGWVVPTGEPCDMAAKVAQLIKPVAGSESAMSISASVSKFSWSAIAESMVSECRHAMSDYQTIYEFKE